MGKVIVVQWPQDTRALYKRGYLNRHLRKFKTLNPKKHNRLKGVNGSFSWEKLEAKAKESGIKVYLTKSRSGGVFEAARMGFGSFKLEELEEAVVAFSQVWFEAFE